MSDEPREFVDVRPNRLFFRHIIRKIFLEDWAMKLVALLITLGLWLGVTGLSTPTTERMTGVPLTLRYPNDIEVTNSPIQEVDIVISGDKRKIAQINRNDLNLSVDISDVAPGDRVISLSPASVFLQLPTGIKLDRIDPNRIAVRIEAVDERDIAVRAETTGEPPEGYELYEQVATPSRVRVRGPASFIRSLEFVPTEPVDLTRHTADFIARQVPVGTSNPRASVLDTTTVDVLFRIGEKRIERVYSVAVRDSSRRATAILFGGQSLFEGITPEDFSVELVRNESGTEAPRLVLPPVLEGKVEVRQVRLR